MADERKDNSKIINPHDKFIRETLGRKEIAKDLLKVYLPSPIIKHINLKTLKISKDTHIDKELTDHFSDIIYTVELKGKKSFIYFLFEHKSYPDKLALFQVLRNMVKIWEGYIKQNRNIKKLPVIVPILLYHGKKAWKYSNNSNILFEEVEDTEKYVPTFSSELFDVSHIPDEDIKGKILTQIILLTLKYIFKPELSDKLDQIFDLFNSLSSKKKVTEYLEVLLRYLTNAMNKEDEAVLQETFTKRITIGGDFMPTIAEAWIQKGIKKGKTEVKEEMADKMIELGMSNSDIRKITGLSLKKINELREKK